MSNSERSEYIAAVFCLRSKPPLTLRSRAPGARSHFDDFVVAHIAQTPYIHRSVKENSLSLLADRADPEILEPGPILSLASLLCLVVRASSSYRMRLQGPTTILGLAQIRPRSCQVPSFRWWTVLNIREWTSNPPREFYILHSL